MRLDTVLSHDGIPLRYAYNRFTERPRIVLIMPFGLKVVLAKAFFDFCGSHYDVVTWESRLILDPTWRDVAVEEFAAENHVKDLLSVLSAWDVSNSILVGYCSGAGIALAAANMAPHLFSTLILVHGEYVLLDERSCTTQFAAEIDSLLCLAAKSEEHARLVFDKVSSERPMGNSNIPEGIDTPFTRLSYLRRYATNYLAYKSTDFKALARSVTQKTLLLTGKCDIQANVRSTQTIYELIENADIRVDPKADHYGILREDSKTLIAIWNYLGEQQI